MLLVRIESRSVGGSRQCQIRETHLVADTSEWVQFCLRSLVTDALDGKRAYGSPRISAGNLPNLTLNGSSVEY